MRIFSHPERFYEAFSGLAERVSRCAALLGELLADPERADEVLARMTTVEHEAADLRAQVLQEGTQVPVTPLPREDVHHVASMLSDMVGTLRDAAGHARSLHLGSPREPAARMADVVVRAARCMEASVAGIRARNYIDHRCAEMEGLAEEAHGIYDTAVEALFAGAPDPVEVIRWKALYDVLERVVDQCQAVENALTSIVVANR